MDQYAFPKYLARFHPYSTILSSWIKNEKPTWQQWGWVVDHRIPRTAMELQKRSALGRNRLFESAAPIDVGENLVCVVAMNEISHRIESEWRDSVLVPIIRCACRVQFEIRLGLGVGVSVVCMVRETAFMGETGSRGEWMTRSGVPAFTIFSSAGMMWTSVACGWRDDRELARNQALKGTNVRDLSGWGGDLGWEHGGGRGIIVVVFTSL